MKNSHATKKATKNLQEGDRVVLSTAHSPLLELAAGGISGSSDTHAMHFAAEALYGLAGELTALHLAATNPELPLADEHVNAALYRLSVRAQCAGDLAYKIDDARREEAQKNGGAT